MQKRLNGNLKFYIYIGLLVASLAASYAVFGRDVIEMKPKVETAMKHVIEDEIITPQIQEDIVEIKADVKELLGRIPE